MNHGLFWTVQFASIPWPVPDRHSGTELPCLQADAPVELVNHFFSTGSVYQFVNFSSLHSPSLTIWRSLSLISASVLSLSRLHVKQAWW